MTDILDVADERMILLGERVLVLNPVASAVHRLLDGGGWREARALIADLESVVPLPDAPIEALERLLGELGAENLVETDPG
ncbi:MAG: hypothetical protein NTX33_06770 [Propionibacteriales bacterium]|nr:hypothetical protein [Propionibacteriales bacterium]